MSESWIEDYIGRGIFEGAPDTPEEVDAYLRSQGYDPDSLVSRLKARIGEALQNAKARTEREAAMKRSNEIAAAREQVVSAAREMTEATRLLPCSGVTDYAGHNIDLYPAFNALANALKALDALTADPDEDDTRELQAVRDAG